MPVTVARKHLTEMETCSAELGAFDYYYNTMKQNLNYSQVGAMFVSTNLVSGSLIEGGGAVFLPDKIRMEPLLANIRNSIAINGQASFIKLVNALRSIATYSKLANNLEGNISGLASQSHFLFM